MHDPYAGFAKNVLSNELTVYSQFLDHELNRVVQCEIVVHSGSREDPINLPGLAHFVEHCVSENIPGMTSDQAEEFFESLGCRIDFGRNGYLSIRYFFTIPANRFIFRRALRIFGTMLLRASLEKDIEQERKIIQCEFAENYFGTSDLQREMQTRKNLFRGHYLETKNFPVGRFSGIMRTTQKDLGEYYNKHYVPANMSLVVVGALETDKVIEDISRSPFGDSKNGKRNPVRSEAFDFKSLPSYINRFKWPHKFNPKIEQTEYHAAWAFPVSFSPSAREVFTEMLNHIIFDEIRKKYGFTYKVLASFEHFQDVIEYSIGAWIHPGATLLMNQLIIDCIDSVSKRPDLFTLKLKKCIHERSMIDLSIKDICEKSGNDLEVHHRMIPLQEEVDGFHEVRFWQMKEAADLLSADRQYTFIDPPEEQGK